MPLKPAREEIHTINVLQEKLTTTGDSAPILWATALKGAKHQCTSTKGGELFFQKNQSEVGLRHRARLRLKASVSDCSSRIPRVLEAFKLDCIERKVFCRLQEDNRDQTHQNNSSAIADVTRIRYRLNRIHDHRSIEIAALI
ncbi:hypothetical protein M407DRAFT_35114 [Tulasnella calospora MUT 4182]|uniref:Uncharacterized protein n=1 Tax=Tulasnella calospora MUT 4182 TaxID=1051891 RepID=A0A0C3PZL5_9AGAM|nr:hypothetical protein M407DRAFT_35114 [Tulasnella calospora MUT 4182]